MSIRRRLMLWYGLLMFLSLLAFAVAIFLGGTWQLRQSLDRELTAAARQIADALLQDEEPLTVDIAYRVLTPAGVTIHASGLPARRVPLDQPVLAEAVAGRMTRQSVAVTELNYFPAVDRWRTSLRTGSQIRLLTIPVGVPTRLVLQVGKLDTDVLRLQRLLITVLLVILGLGLPGAAAGGWWLAGKALQPVRDMTATAQRIEAHDLNERLPRSANGDEISALADTLNGMLDRIQAAMERERRFIADVSHDLRTPLALAKSTIGVALNKPRSTDELDRSLREVDVQIDRVIGLIEATMLLSRSDAGRLLSRRELVDLAALLADLCDTSAAYVEDARSQRLAAAIEPELWIDGDSDALTRMLLNLIDNASQYSPEGGEIRVDACKIGQQIVVKVSDDGVGIAQEDIPHVFERFYRGDRSRSSTAKAHHGLGLSIAQAIAVAHGGRITVETQLGEGSEFTVKLPATKRKSTAAAHRR